MDDIALQIVQYYDHFARVVGADALLVSATPENGYKIGLIALCLLFGNGFFFFWHGD
jgi:hypothetical protein